MIGQFEAARSNLGSAFDNFGSIQDLDFHIVFTREDVHRLEINTGSPLDDYWSS